jgi:hypothetical protein
MSTTSDAIIHSLTNQIEELLIPLLKRYLTKKGYKFSSDAEACEIAKRIGIKIVHEKPSMSHTETDVTMNIRIFFINRLNKPIL